MRYEILIAAYGAAGASVQFETNNPLPLDFYDEANRFVIPENATLADRILERFAYKDPDRILQTFVKLADELGPWVNRETIIARAPEPRLSGRLFDFDSVVSKYLGSKAEEFYDHVKPYWEWNSRYWEQVALMNLARYMSLSNSREKMDYLENAVTHARHAVAVEHHPFPLTTLGKVLLSHMAAPGMSIRESFNEAFDRLSEAIAMEERRNRVTAQPYGILFGGVLKYLSAGGELDHRQMNRLAEILAKASTKLRGDREMQQQVIFVTQALC